MDDLSDLYQEIILSHNKRPRNEGELDPRTGEAEGYNPLCGDRIRIYVHQTEGGLLDAVTFTGEGCAISRASASIMTLANIQLMIARKREMNLNNIEKGTLHVHDIRNDIAPKRNSLS